MMMEDKRGWALVGVYPKWSKLLSSLRTSFDSLDRLADDVEVFHDPGEMAFRTTVWDEWLQRHGFVENDDNEGGDAGLEGDDEDDQGELDPTDFPLPRLDLAIETAGQDLAAARGSLDTIGPVLPPGFQKKIENCLGGVEKLLDEAALTSSQWPHRVSELRDANSCLLESFEPLLWLMDKLSMQIFGIWGAYFFQRAHEAGVSLYDDYPCMPPANSADILQPVAERLLKGTECQDVLDERNRWLYDMMMAGEKLKRILAELRQNVHGWTCLDSIQAVKSAARTYAKKHGLPEPPKRKPGRPAGS